MKATAKQPIGEVTLQHSKPVETGLTIKQPGNYGKDVSSSKIVLSSKAVSTMFFSDINMGRILQIDLAIDQHPPFLAHHHNLDMHVFQNL